MFGRGHASYLRPYLQPRPGLEGLRYYSLSDIDEESLTEYYRAQAQMGNNFNMNKRTPTATKKVKNKSKKAELELEDDVLVAADYHRAQAQMGNGKTSTLKVNKKVKDVKEPNNQVKSGKICKFYIAGKCMFGQECRNIHPEGIRVEKFKKVETKSFATIISELSIHGAEEDDSEGDSGIDVDGGLSPEVATEETVTLRDLYWSPGSQFNSIYELKEFSEAYIYIMLLSFAIYWNLYQITTQVQRNIPRPSRGHRWRGWK